MKRNILLILVCVCVFAVGADRPTVETLDTRVEKLESKLADIDSSVQKLVRSFGEPGSLRLDNNLEKFEKWVKKVDKQLSDIQAEQKRQAKDIKELRKKGRKLNDRRTDKRKTVGILP